MKRYCIALELIAFAIHPGDTQSTTTICLEVKSACLYLTPQNNFSFETATRQGVHDVIDELVKASVELQKGTKLEALKKYFWEKCCALYTKPTGSKKAEEEIDQIYNKGDPLTMSGYQGSTPLAKGERHHAIFVAYRSIICGHQEEDEDEET
jgi:hypothetical protein